MKEYEKLALKSASYRCGTSSKSLDSFISEVHSYGFEQGFLKCRERSQRTIDHCIEVFDSILEDKKNGICGCESETMYEPGFICGFHKALNNLEELKQLGEKDVPTTQD